MKGIKESIRKVGNNLTKLNEKDLLDCKNAWETFPFGKFLLMKVFELLNDGNSDDYDYIKKTITVKHFKKLINIDYTKPENKFREVAKLIVSNPEFGGNDKYNKPYKLAGIIESTNEIKSLDLLRLRQYLLGEYTFK